MKNKFDVGMGNTCYPNFVTFSMDEFDRHLYLYRFNGLTPYLRIHMKFKYSSVDHVQDNNFMHKIFGPNAVIQQK